MTREEAIQYAEDKFRKGLYRLELGYLNRGLYQIVAREVDFMRVAIAALREQPQWIRVSKRLPEDGQKVLVCTATKIIKDARYSERMGKFIASGNITVTHWMPQPELPDEAMV